MLELKIYSLPEEALSTERLIGNNAREMLVLVEDDDFKNHGELLGKILGSIGYDIQQDARVVAIHQEEIVNIKCELETTKHLLLFGIKPARVGLNVNSKRRLVILEDLVVIRSGTLANIANDSREKRALWEVLKTVFKK